MSAPRPLRPVRGAYRLLPAALGLAASAAALWPPAPAPGPLGGLLARVPAGARDIRVLTLYASRDAGRAGGRWAGAGQLRFEVHGRPGDAGLDATGTGRLTVFPSIPGPGWSPQELTAALRALPGGRLQVVVLRGDGTLLGCGGPIGVARCISARPGQPPRPAGARTLLAAPLAGALAVTVGGPVGAP